MHIAYSAPLNTRKQPARPRTDARYRGYQAACQKHKDTIAAIQQYLPGWVPPFQQAVGSSNLRAINTVTANL